jgi:hypothetical protein
MVAEIAPSVARGVRRVARVFVTDRGWRRVILAASRGGMNPLRRPRAGATYL